MHLLNASEHQPLTQAKRMVPSFLPTGEPAA